MSRSLTLARTIERYTGADGAHPTAVRGLTLYRHSAPQPPCEVLYEPSLCMVAQGAKQATLGDREYRYDAAKCLLVSADVPALVEVVAATPQIPYLGLALVLDPLEVGELVTQLGPAELQSSARAFEVAEVDSTLLDVL